MIILLDKHFDLDSLPRLMYRGFKKITVCDIIVYDDLADLMKKLRKAIREFVKSARQK